MFVSQVIFESLQENEERLISIAKRKKEEMTGVQGLLSSECWRKENGDTVGYCLVNKWGSKADFQVWIKAAHTEKPHHAGTTAGNAAIKKTAYQFEVVP